MSLLTRRFRRTLLGFVLLAAATVAAWHLLASWFTAGAERFYLLLPPFVGGGFYLLSPNGWRDLRPQLRRAAVYVASLGLLATAAQVLVSLAFRRPGASLFWMVRPGETLFCAYFLGSISLVVFLLLGLLRLLCHWADVRLFGPCPEMPPRGRLFLRQELPLLLVLVLSFPYLMAVLYVHRYKAPISATPQSRLGLPSEDVTFTTSDGVTLHGWFVPAKSRPSPRTLLFCHGLGGARSDGLSMYPVAECLEANMLVFDLRSHGESDGHTVSYGIREKLDVLAAADYLRKQRPDEAREIIGMGGSLGAAVMAMAAAEVEPPFDGVILDSSFSAATDMTDSVLHMFPGPVRRALVLPGFPLASLHAGCDLNEARPIDAIAHIRAPLLVIHDRDDKLIPVEHSERLFAKAAEPKDILLTREGGHCSSSFIAGDEYLQKCRDLLAQVKTGKSKSAPLQAARK
jgi:pimeloyl-ACP methyl ester carboxylesterase